MIIDKHSVFLKTFFAIIIVYIAVSIAIMTHNSSEDFSFKVGRYEDFNGDWYCENTGEKFNCPYEISGIEAGEILTITKKLPIDMETINCLVFRTYQGACRVYIDGELRQEYDDAPYRIVSKFPPSATILVDLTEDDAGKTVEIEYNCLNKNYIGNVSSVVIGQKDAIIRTVLKKHAPVLLIAVLLVIFGLICVVVFYFLYRESKKNKFIVYLGLFLTMVGLWIITSSRVRQLFFGDITTLQYLELWLVHIIPIPFIFFTDLRCGGRYRRFSIIMLSICYADFVISNILHFTGIYDKAYLLELGHICCALTVVYFIICNIRDYRSGYKKESIQIVLAVSVLVAFSFIDIVKLYMDRQWTIGVFIAVGVLVFSIIILGFSVQDYIIESRIQMAMIAEGEAKEQFFATMSHDIRTPINAIIGMNEIIQRESKENSTLEYSRDIQRASETLMSIVNNILDFSKIRDGKYEIVRSDFLVLPMLADVIKMTSTLAENKGLEFVISVDENMPSEVNGDENALKRILTNLTSNAIKYTQKGKVEFITKVIKSQTDSDNSCCIRFAIKDSGIGIKKEDIPHIFDVFSRMDGEKNKNVQGTGLGLAITSALANSMESEIIVSSVYGEGSEFYLDVKFPVINAKTVGKFSIEAAKKADEDSKTKEEKSDDKGTFFDENKTILIVDDTKMNLKVMQKLLQLNGVKVVTAGSGDECIKYAMERHFDMILLDDMMPVKDGRETLLELKNLKSSAIEGVPVIALTANAGPGARDMYLSLGFTDYMSKPVTMDSLNKLLWNYLG